MNKKLRIVITIIALCIGLIFVGTKAYATTGKTINDTTRIRKKASTNSDIVEVVSKKGETLEVLSEEDNWYKVKYKLGSTTYEGYVRNDLLEVEKTEEKEEDSKKEEIETSKETSENTETVEIKENAKIGLKADTEVQLLPLIYSCKIAKFSANTEVSVIELVGNWCHIEADGKDGWILKNKMANSDVTETTGKEENTDKTETKNEENKSDKEETEKVKKTETKKLYVTTTTLNLREKADTSSRVVTQLDRSDLVTVVEVVDNTWNKVKYGNYTGYVASKYLSEEKPSATTSRGAQEVRQAEEKEKAKVENNTTKNSTSKENTTTNTTTSNTTTTNKTEIKKESTTTSKTTATAKTDTTKKTESSSKTTATSSSTTSKTTTKAKSSSKVTGSDVVAYAKKFLGCKYVYGAAGPNTFDCSGFTSYVYKHFGYSLNRTSSGQRSNGKAVSKSNLQPGDIVCFSGHVGIYVGDNKFIHAPRTGDVVKFTSLSNSYYVRNYITARRIIY